MSEPVTADEMTMVEKLADGGVSRNRTTTNHLHGLVFKVSPVEESEDDFHVVISLYETGEVFFDGILEDDSETWHNPILGDLPTYEDICAKMIDHVPDRHLP